ncbi:MAG TPA: alpha-L-fucosidase [Terriglobia bacterium]|nr:alpha-L-fucosidase [Terriglobia bacterium]
MSIQQILKQVCLVILCLVFLGGSVLLGADPVPGNRKEEIEHFRDLGFGLFIHWSVDSQLGSVISHSLVGASDDYVKRFYDELPRTFDPEKFNPHDWAVLAKLAGFRYVVFTTKHHSGFCMFNTATTQLNIMNTPFHRDVTAEVFRAFRAQGLEVGVYFSPDDFHFLYTHGKVISRRRPGVTPPEFPALMQYDQAQLRELLTNYGKIDFVFLDGAAEGLRELCWKLQPNVIVTRGALQTPEQYIPGVPLEGAWESNLTIGTQWQYKPTNETYKSGTEIIDDLIQTRAEGGNLLLNIGPKPDGEIPIEQEARLRELALWNFVNGEAIYAVRPWVITNEGNIWFTKRKNENTVYAFVTRTPWKLGESKTFVLRSIRAGKDTQVSVLGQSGEVLEYRPDVVPRTTWSQEENGLHITATRAQRLYNNREWPNPVVLKITHAEVGMAPPKVEVRNAEWDPTTGTAVLHATLTDLGGAKSVQVGFEYRRRKEEWEMYGPDIPWTETPYQTLAKPASFSARISDLKKDGSYEFRAIIKHPLVTLRSPEQPFGKVSTQHSVP